MTEGFSLNVLVRVVAQICQMIGFEKTMTSPLLTLADILKEFISKLGRISRQYAEHSGRSDVNLSDLTLAFYDSGVCPAKLAEFLEIVSPLPTSLRVPKYPVVKPKLYTFQSSKVVEVSPDNCDSKNNLKIKISLSKIKEACRAKKSKCKKNKKKKRKDKKKSLE